MRLLYLLLLGLVVLNRIEAQTKPKIYYLHIKSDIRYRFATTVVTSKVVNPDLKSHESTFDVTLPNEAFIINFTLTVGTKTYVGNVTTKETAREVYLRDKSKGKSAAHISVKPRETNTFYIQVNVAAEQKVTFELRYQELLQRKLGSYNHVVYVKPGEPVADLRIEMDIEESRKLIKLRIPPIESDLFTIKDQKDANAATTITRPSAKRAHILFEPTLKIQTAQGGPNGLDCQFKVKYDVDRKTDGGDILLVNGYFVHFFAPSGIKPKPKDVVFILDKSGSMNGRKLDQLKQAMSTILSKIQSKERVNILTFSSSVHPWEVVEKLIHATAANIKRAATFVNETYANGGTNIEGAIGRGVALLDERKDKTRAPVLIFLTDGEPTIGQINPEVILKNVIKFNENKIPIFALAFGRGADYDFIKKLAAQNNGFGRKIYEDFDAANQISDFYSEISAILLQNVTFKYLPGSVDEKTLTKRKVPNIFEGSEVVVAGMMAGDVMYDIKPNVIATDLNGELSLDVPSDGVVRLKFTTNKDINAITEKIWAYLKIKQWLQQMYASTSEMVQEELKQNITTLALKYNFVTPFTSMVVSLPENLHSSLVDPLMDSPANERMHPSQDLSLFHNNQMLSSDPGMADLVDVINNGPILATVAPDAGLSPIPTSNSVTGPSGNSRGASSSGTFASKVTVDKNRTTGSKKNFKSNIPPHDSTSGYTLVGVKGIALPLCLENPSKAEETKRYTLFRDLDSGTVVSVEFTDSPNRITRITYVRINAQTVTELFPTHLVENGVRRDWISNTFYTYVHGSQGSGVKLEVTSLSNNRLIVHFDYTENLSENIDGSLALPIRGEIKDNHNFQGFQYDQMKELSLLAKKTRKVRMMIPVTLSSVMNCWIVRSSLCWTLQPTV
ncbi:inter-alpha-trypsin inhibitor heavy chain H4-like [Mizuhopecten yessoensis]|uniref:Inter-alpha-trypsin inhibitor heavy chain H4 n=1 Tax=Mizuhopecten yessoensis TaxID=6573 RepID=A0A210Q821_MIZYE|nr:inter-alpha-trypsin inhibitor heavy chain H4-like [Mizuhopecten yessoensis]OWF44880.1 Inter-alpha-trypsin inhibitor heavy chain H4 [Mizuhopecten yessoensis]